MNRLLLLLTLGSTLASNPNFKVTQDHEEIPERGPVPRYLVATGGGTFTVNPPPGWEPEFQPQEQTILFRSEALQAVFSLRFTTNSPAITESGLKAQMLEKLPSALISDASQCVARDTAGPSLELLYRSASSAAYRTRVGVINFSPVAAEVTLTAAESTFPKAQFAWVYVLNSLGRAPALQK